MLFSYYIVFESPPPIPLTYCLSISFPYYVIYTIGDAEEEEEATPHTHSLTAATEDLVLLISRPFALPFESKNCLVQVYTSKNYDESLHLKVRT
jgi:hypothetical protein